MQNKSFLLQKGIGFLFNTWGDEHIKSGLVKNILDNICELVDDPSELDEVSKSIVYGFLSENQSINPLSKDGWRKDIESSSESLSNETLGQWVLLNEGRRRFNGHSIPHFSFYSNLILKKADWSSVGRRLSPLLRYNSETSSIIFSSWLEEDREDYMSFVDDEIFGKKWGWEVRSVVYKELIAQGLLTKSYARKLRSEASSKASCAALNCLVKNEELYSNYDELITQFMDTRHEDVAGILASNAPIHMLSFLLGSDFYWAKSTAERRFNEYYASKGESSE